MTEPADDTVTLPRRLVDEVVAAGRAILASGCNPGRSFALSAAITRLAAALPPEPRAPGWYWVRLSGRMDWVAAQFEPSGDWFYGQSYLLAPAVIGPRIEEPGE